MIELKHQKKVSIPFRVLVPAIKIALERKVTFSQLVTEELENMLNRIRKQEEHQHD